MSALKIIERALVSKTGQDADCEDSIVIAEHFAAVIDGATAKTHTLRDGFTPGKLAANLISQAITQLEPRVSARQAVEEMRLSIWRYYERNQLTDVVKKEPWERLTASIAIFSRAKR